ncbi:retrovirus-related pol polyprotein from transposon TNT 1-94 [Tanacetum coccineum]
MDGLINQVNLKSVEISNLNTRLQEKVLVITTLKDELKKLKGKDLVDNTVTKHTIDPEMLTNAVEPITPKLLNNRTDHSAYIKHTQEEAVVLRDLVEHVKANYPLDHPLEIFLSKTSTSATGSQPSGNTKKDKIQPTGRTFTIVGNAFPLTRITTTTEVPLRKPTALNNETPKPVVTLVYSRKPRTSKTNVSVSKSKVLKSVSANKEEPNQSWGSIVYVVPSFSLDECRVTYVEGNWTLLIPVGKFLIRTVEVAFPPTHLLNHTRASLPISLLSNASKTKSWLWHRRLSHLNFGAINHLARHGLVRGLPKLKFKKDHLCSACAMGKSKKKPHKPKSEDTNQEKLYLLHMDLYGPMRVASVNGKKYILIIVDDYSELHG